MNIIKVSPRLNQRLAARKGVRRPEGKGQFPCTRVLALWGRFDFPAVPLRIRWRRPPRCPFPSSLCAPLCLYAVACGWGFLSPPCVSRDALGLRAHLEGTAPCGSHPGPRAWTAPAGSTARAGFRGETQVPPHRSSFAGPGVCSPQLERQPHLVAVSAGSAAPRGQRYLTSPKHTAGTGPPACKS